jgi:FkbM family methyltransferase
MLGLLNFLFIYCRRIQNKIRKNSGKNSILYSSQKLLEKNFKQNAKFVFIQVGANDGISFDFLYDFVVKRNSEGVVIEPIKEYYNELIINYINYPKIIAINKAIHPTEKNSIIYKIAPNSINKYPNWVKGIASLDLCHHKKLDIKTEDIIQEIVLTEHLMVTIENNKFIIELDYLQIDTEGFDY